LVINAFLDGIWMVIERGQLVRRASYIIMMYITTRYIFWAMDFASSHADGLDATGKGLLIGAIGVPLSALQGYVFKLYEQGRGDGMAISAEVKTGAQ
jgi:hypothetical protein